jgi:phosphoribosylanthranilate isomerase
MIQVKICGITNIDDALTAIEAGADALGFIFYKGSKRFIDPVSAGKIVEHLPPLTTTVGVFVNASPEDIKLACKISRVAMVQLSGNESGDYIGEITLPVIKTLHIDKNLSLDRIDFHAYHQAHLLLDSAGSWGGSGMPAPWKICAKIAKKFKVILAGGLTPENVVEATRQVQPAAVDVSSGVEISPGIKDPLKIQAFISAVKKYIIYSKS